MITRCMEDKTHASCDVTKDDNWLSLSRLSTVFMSSSSTCERAFPCQIYGNPISRGSLALL
jgi:hypothetical protein